MNKKILAIAIALSGLSATLLTSCNRDPIYDKTPHESDFSNAAFVKMYNAIVGSSRIYAYADGVPVNGAAIAYGATFPVHTANPGFVIRPGTHGLVVKDTLRTSTFVPLNFTLNAQANSKYSEFLYDSITAPKQITVPTEYTIPTDTSSRLRFANFWRVPTGVPPAVDVFSKKQQKNLHTNLQFTQVSDFIPFPSALSDTLYFFATGTTDTLARVNGYSTTQRRSYTLILRGSYNNTSTTGNPRTVSSITEN